MIKKESKKDLKKSVAKQVCLKMALESTHVINRADFMRQTIPQFLARLLEMTYRLRWRVARFSLTALKRTVLYFLAVKLSAN